VHCGQSIEVLADDVVNVEWRVVIEEAAPDAYAFRALISEELAKRGFGHVVVVTE
jgi:hypothetical protein